jgi:hypothetical protein
MVPSSAYEHAAEIIAWAVGDQSDGIRAPSIPRNERDQLAAGPRGAQVAER